MSKTAKTAGKSATLASMTKPAAATTEVPAVAVVEKPKPIDWSQFPAAEVAVYTRNAATAVDREATTDEFIKTQVHTAYQATSAAGNPKQPIWFVIPFGDSAVVEAFIKDARLYAGFKGYTLRGGENPKVKGEARFCVKPKEHRAKKAAK